MPANIESAIQFLETQWSSINENKLKGINAELRLEAYLQQPEQSRLYDYIIPGGWIISPGKNDRIDTITKARKAFLPIPKGFSWTGGVMQPPFSALVLANAYFRQVGIEAFLTRFDTELDPLVEATFEIPRSRHYPTPYELNIYRVGSDGLEVVDIKEVTIDFPERQDLRGMRAYRLDRIDRDDITWQDTSLITKLFWKEYTRYYLHRRYLVSSNDLDFFLISKSGRSYPIEFKSKEVYADDRLGDWFGIDLGPFSKLAFFVSLSNNMEALYIVEEVDDRGDTINWWGTKFSELLRYCHWVTQSGGAGMGGASSSTIKVPKSIFIQLNQLLQSL